MSADSQHDPPDWLMSYAHDVRCLLGLGDDWHIRLAMVDRIDDDDAAAGETDLDVPYLRAGIKLRNGLSDDETRSALFHELLHVALAPIDLMVDRLIMRLPSSRNIQAFGLKSDAFEQTIVRLERALRANIAPATDDDA
jgi:hypothetical protein